MGASKKQIGVKRRLFLRRKQGGYVKATRILEWQAIRRPDLGHDPLML
jgi:hypothetical protein